ncbi:unnamed protein product, partial [Discosporangium mesarthrocarpum]
MELQQQIRFGQLETTLARLDKSRDLFQRVCSDLVPGIEKGTVELTMHMLAEVRASITQGGSGIGAVTPGVCEAGVAGSASAAGTRGTAVRGAEAMAAGTVIPYGAGVVATPHALSPVASTAGAGGAGAATAGSGSGMSVFLVGSHNHPYS